MPKQIHQKTLKDFTRTDRVFKHEDLPKMALRQLEEVPPILADFSARIAGALNRGDDQLDFGRRDPMKIMEIPNDHADLRMFRCEGGSKMVVLSENLDAFIGGIGTGMTWIEEDYRGRGYAPHMLLAALEEGGTMLAPGFYSEGGYATRKAAHRMACEKAYDAGKELHPDNYERYGLSPIPGVNIQDVRSALENRYADLLLAEEGLRREHAADQFRDQSATEKFRIAQETFEGRPEYEALGLDAEITARSPVTKMKAYGCPIHGLSLSEYTRDARVIPEEEDILNEEIMSEGLEALRALVQGAILARRKTIDLFGGRCKFHELPCDKDGARVFEVPSYDRTIMVTDDLSEAIGGKLRAHVWFKPDFREDHPKHLFLALENSHERQFRDPVITAFTHDAMAAAHEDAVRRAFANDQEIHEENYAAYGLSPVPGVDVYAVTVALEFHFADLLRDNETTRREVAEEQFKALNALEIIDVARETFDAEMLEELGIEVPEPAPAGP